MEREGREKERERISSKCLNLIIETKAGLRRTSYNRQERKINSLDLLFAGF